jgi:hypothetical protein
MEWDDDDRVSTEAVVNVFKNFITDKLNKVTVSTPNAIIDFQSWAWSEGFPRTCFCEVVDRSKNEWMSSLYPRTVKIIMHGALYDHDTLLFNPSIYFVGTDNKRTEVYIRQSTSEQLRAALQNFVSSHALGQPSAAPSPPQARPLDGETQNGSLMQLLHKILEVCERIDRKKT